MTPVQKKAFTMVELLVVMTILSIVGLIAALGVSNVIDYANRKDTEAVMQLFDIALDQYKTDMGTFPSCTGGTVVDYLTNKNHGWKRAGMSWFPKRALVIDAWDNEFGYCSYQDYDGVLAGFTSGRGVERTPGMKTFYNSETFQIYSMGPNMKTWPAKIEDGGHPRLCGTEPDDIRNWKQDVFYTTRPTIYNN